MQGKGDNSVGLGWRRGQKSSSLPSWRSPLRTDPSREQSTRQKHLKYGWLSEFYRHNTFQGRSYVSSEVYLWGNPRSLKYIREAETVCSLQRSWKKCISRINISGTFGTHLRVAEICPVEGFNTLGDWGMVFNARDVNRSSVVMLQNGYFSNFCKSGTL